jgi:radical SAM superfamily enzyme YgiQ (UPF0313 family)
MAHIVLINPRFEVSFWGMEHALPFLGKQAHMPVTALPLLAALTPGEHKVSVLDENVEPLDLDQVAKADIVGLTGMSVQRFRMRELLSELKRRGAFTVVGGPWVTVNEHYFGADVDVRFIGEAETTWPEFLTDWQAGRYKGRYKQVEHTNMSEVPVPRFDLLPMGQYLSGSIQFSRGCPFRCEFCDIIVTFGRRPRVKNVQQIIAELDALRAAGVRRVFIVDDNLIGNKRLVKELLRQVIVYQQERNYPFVFVTETSLDLAEEPELMSLMAEANITKVFIGIESPNEESLRETRKLQNIRGDVDIVQRIHRIQSAGMEVSAGMILGFDADDTSVFDAQIKMITDSRIITAMVGMLYAIPGTPLHERLKQESRLDSADVSEYGSNVIPKRMSRAELRDGYVRVMRALYAPDAFFKRLDALFLGARIGFGAEKGRPRGQSWHHKFLRSILLALQPLVFFQRFVSRVPDPQLALFYRRQMRRFALARPEPEFLLHFAVTCAMHYHVHTLAENMGKYPSALVSSM